MYTNAGILGIGSYGRNFSEIVIKIQNFSFTKMHLRLSSVKWRPFCPGGDELTHWGRVTHICVSKLNIIGSDNGLSPGRRQAIIWTRRQAIIWTKKWNIVNLTLRNKLQWNVYWNSYFFIQENACENVVCEKAAILSRPQCVKENQSQQSIANGVNTYWNVQYIVVLFLSLKIESCDTIFVVSGGTEGCHTDTSADKVGIKATRPEVFYAFMSS